MYVLRSIATQPDSSGRYRMGVAALSESIRSAADAETLVEVRRLKQIGFPYAIERVNRDAHAKAYRGELNGYAERPDLKAPRTIEPWH